MRTPLNWLPLALICLCLSQAGNGMALSSEQVKDYADLDNGSSLSLDMTIDFCFREVLGKKPKDGPTLESRHRQVVPLLEKIESQTGHAPPYKTSEITAIFAQSPGKKAKKEEAQKPPVEPPAKVAGPAAEKTDVEKYDELSKIIRMAYITEPRIRIEGKVRSSDGREYDKQIGPSVRDKYVWEEELKSARKADPGIRFIPSEKSSIGPFRLRRTVEEIEPMSDGIQETGPDGKISDIKGAKLNFSDNRLESGSGAWSTEGAIMYPLIWTKESIAADSRFHVLPSVSWKVQEGQKAGAKDVSELSVGVPMAFDWGGAGDYWTAVVNPFYQTDTHLDGGIWGTTASLAYRGSLSLPFSEKPLMLNNWMRHDDIGGGPSWGWKISPKFLADYSEVTDTSRYSPRAEDDDWFRAGAEIGISFAYKPSWISANQSVNKFPLVLSTSYRFMETFSGDGGYSDLWSTNLTWWFTDYVGFNVEYQKGETPVADQEVDLLSFGLELRY